MNWVPFSHASVALDEEVRAAQNAAWAALDAARVSTPIPPPKPAPRAPQRVKRPVPAPPVPTVPPGFALVREGDAAAHKITRYTIRRKTT